jgi:hypothetical protein
MSSSDWIQVASSRQALSPSDEVPVSWRSSPMTTSTAAPREPVIDRLRQELGDQAQPEQGEEEEQDAGGQGDRRDELGRVVSAEVRHEHRPARDRGQGRARAGGDVAGGTEERVDQRARRSGIEPVLERYARDAGVAEVLRHDERSDSDARRRRRGAAAVVAGSQSTIGRNRPSP